MAETVTSPDITQGDKKIWEGGRSPFKTSYGKIMMWYFLLSDAFTFAGLLISYGALRYSSPSWPVPDFVFSKFPFAGDTNLPLIFVTFMTFVLLASSFTMMRAVQEGHRENKKGVTFWMLLTIIGGLGFLSCQAWEWSTLMGKEYMTISTNPFGTHTEEGLYLNADGSVNPNDPVVVGQSYLIHNVHHAAGHGDDHSNDDHSATSEEHADDSHNGHARAAGDYPDAVVDDQGFIHRKYRVEKGENAGAIQAESFGPKAFGGLFYFITGFHGFHVFSGVLFLAIILINVMSGIYVARQNGYEMVEKIGLYWHFVDLVWVFVFLVFYLL